MIAPLLYSSFQNHSRLSHGPDLLLRTRIGSELSFAFSLTGTYLFMAQRGLIRDDSRLTIVAKKLEAQLEDIADSLTDLRSVSTERLEVAQVWRGAQEYGLPEGLEQRFPQVLNEVIRGDYEPAKLDEAISDAKRAAEAFQSYSSAVLRRAG